MLPAETFVEAGRARGFDFYSGVPCSYLTPFINYVINDDTLRYVAAANEGDAVALAAGASLGRRRAVAMFQNSGLGNALNPLTSLTHPFRIPILVITTWRGEPGRPDEPQHELMGAITGDLLTRMRIKWEYFPANAEDVEAVWERAVSHMSRDRLPYGLIMKRDSVLGVPLRRGLDAAAGRGRAAPEIVRTRGGREPGRRRESLLRIIEGTPVKDTVIVSTTGYASRELFSLADRPNHLYMVGSMGCASSLGTGLAIRFPDRKVVVIDGDGAVLMRMGAMATTGFYAPANLVHVVLDNGVHESTGGQETVASRVDFGAVAAACGYRRIWSGHDPAALTEALRLSVTEGPLFVHLRIRPGTEGKLPRPNRTPAQVRERLERHLNGGVESVEGRSRGGARQEGTGS